MSIILLDVSKLLIIDAAVTGCEDLQFCSATYRLMKISGCQPGESEASSRTNGGVACATVEEKLVTVKYKG